jgi:hypothetical protein
LEADYDEPNMCVSGYYFPNKGFRLDYSYQYEEDGCGEIQVKAKHVVEALSRIWIGLGGDEEVIAGEEVNAVRDWSDFVVRGAKKDLSSV